MTRGQYFMIGKLELCEASDLQDASPQLPSKRDGRVLVTSNFARRGLFMFKLWEMLCLLDSAGQCVPAYLGVRPLRDYKNIRVALHFSTILVRLAFGLC